MELSKFSGKKYKVLVTGGAGFIGSHIVDLLLKKGYLVVVVDDLSSGLKSFVNKRASFYNVDITSPELKEVFKVEKPDFVVHAAAQVSVIKSLQDPIYDAKINILGTINVLEQCKNFNVKKIVFLSSCAVYGEPEYLPVDENHPLKAFSPYGISKHTAEHYLYEYYKNYDIDYLVLRLANVYGPRQGLGRALGVIPAFIEAFLTNGVIKINGDGSQTRDFIYVGDVAEIVVRGLEKPTLRKIMNVGSGREVSVKQIVSILKKQFNKEIPVEYAPPVEGEVKRICLTIDALSRELKWSPRTSFEEGISKTIKWFVKNHKSRMNIIKHK